MLFSAETQDVAFIQLLILHKSLIYFCCTVATLMLSSDGVQKRLLLSLNMRVVITAQQLRQADFFFIWCISSGLDCKIKPDLKQICY